MKYSRSHRLRRCLSHVVVCERRRQPLCGVGLGLVVQIAHGGLDVGVSHPLLQLELTDIEQLVELIAPRPLLLLSATEDRYSADTPQIVHASARAYREAGAPQALEHHRAHGGHALTQERFDTIVDWVIAQLSDVPR